MQIKFTNLTQNMKHSNVKISSTQIGGLNSNHANNAQKKFLNTHASNAASVDLSKSGRYKARMLRESERNSITDDVMQKAESTINDIIDTVKSGGKLTKDQERIFNDEMKNMASKHYNDMKDMKLSEADVLQELKENFLQRQQLFADMQQKVESEMSQKQDLSDNVKLMTYQQEKEEKEKLIEILKESMDDDSKETNTNLDENVEDDSSQDSFDVATENTDENVDSTNAVDDAVIRDKQRAANVIDKNSKQISDMKEQSANERAQELQYAKYLDRDYEQIMELLDHDDVSADEKLKAYNDYEQNSHANAYNREVHRVKKAFDLETWLVGRIQFQSHSEIHDVMADGPDFSQIGTEFIKKFLV